MADEHSQRAYRSNETIARSGQAKPAASGNDPLAELARLIGQSDPFGDFNRQSAQRGAPEAAAPNAGYHAAPPSQPQHYEPQYYDHTQVAAAQAYDAVSHAEHDRYDQQSVPAFLASGSYDPNNPPYSAGEEDFYDDVAPSKRRSAILIVAGIFGLAIIGTAGAFGYRAIFGASHTSGPPPVIKAETTPSKVVPASAAKDAQSNKMITDRVGGAQGEKLVSREETPVARPPVVAGNPPESQSAAPAQGSGVVSAEPKKVRTISIRPDDQPGANTAEVAPVAASTAPAAAPLALVPDQPTRQVQTQRIPASQTASAPSATPAPQPSNAPLSLNPNGAPQRAAAPVRTASVPAAAHGTQYGVQVSSQRSEAEAQAAYKALEGKFGSVLNGQPHFVYRIDLGAKGTYYRAMVGPFASNEQASQVCSRLKAAGGSCFIQRN
jgi:hypothetical protein